MCVKSMASMFNGASKFDQNINGSACYRYEWMFTKALEFNQDISGWNVNSVKNMQSMFANARKFNQNIGK